MPLCGLCEEGTNGRKQGSTVGSLKGAESWCSGFPNMYFYLFILK